MNRVPRNHIVIRIPEKRQPSTSSDENTAGPSSANIANKKDEDENHGNEQNEIEEMFLSYDTDDSDPYDLYNEDNKVRSTSFLFFPQSFIK